MSKSLLEKLLDYYHITYDEYLYITRPLKADSFLENHKFDDIDKALEVVRSVLNEHGKILIFGDYDADGIMGTSILVKMFQYLNIEASYYIPTRYVDGYGITVEHAKRYVEEGYKLVIMVDNGVSAFEAIDYLREHNVKTLVLDHHTIQEKVPNADAICHPTYSHFGEIASSGAFTAFVFSIYLLGRIDEYLSILASISLISDMMPLLDYNRDLLRYVIEHYQTGKYLPIDLLADNEKLDSFLIGAKVAPRINSIGRIIEDREIDKIVHYFVYDDKEFILNYFNFIIDTNEKRKEIIKEDTDNIVINEDENVIFLLGNYKEGVIGLIANSLLNKYHVPVIVFTRSIDGTYKGSARVPEGYNIVNLFSENSDLLITFGGHALAGGCSIKEEHFEEFKKRFISSVNKQEVIYIPQPSIDLTFAEISFDNYNLIQSFAPFGESWEMPNFKIKHIKTSELFFSKDNKHIVTRISNTFKIVGFNFSKEMVRENAFINIYGTLKMNSYKGYDFVEFVINKIEPYN